MEIDKDPSSLNDPLDDFDIDDDDLADLMLDEDETPKNRKSTTKSPAKVSPISSFPKDNNSPAKSRLNLRKNFDLLNSSLDKESDADENEEPNRGENGDTAGNTSPFKGLKDVKNKASPVKANRNKIDMFLDEESNYISDLALDQPEKLTSPTKIPAKISASPLKKQKQEKLDDVEFDDDNYILDTLEDSTEKSLLERTKKQSFMDDLFGSPSKPKSAKSTTKNLAAIFDDIPSKQEKDIEGESVFSGYTPSAVTSRTAPTGRRQSVKFEDEITSRPQTRERSVVSKKVDDVGVKDVSETSSRRSVLTKSSSHSVENNDDDDDLLKLLRSKKSNPPKSNLSSQRTDVQSDSEKAPAGNEARRKSSSADWLGLKPSEVRNHTEEPSKKQVTNRVESKESTDSVVARSEGKQSPEIEGRRKGRYPWRPDSSQMSSFDFEGDAAPKVKTTDLSKQHSAKSVAAPKHSVSHDNVNLAEYNTSNDELQIATKSSPDMSGQIAGSLTKYRQEETFSTTHKTSALPFTPVHQPTPMISGNDFAALQTLLTSVQFERDQLLQSAEVARKKQEEELRALENSLRSQLKLNEETFEQRIKSMQEEHEVSLKRLRGQAETTESAKQHLVNDLQVKIENLEKEQNKEIQKLKALHNDAIAMLKQDHEDALARLKRLKDQEVEAISSSQLQTKSLQSLSDQLEARASELAALQEKVDEKHKVAVQEKEALLATKEKDLRALEGRLRWQMEEGDQERTRLQQLVLRLETRLQNQTREGEQDRWDVQQLKAKLEVQQKFLDEERKIQVENMEREKEKLRMAQDSMMNEQKAVLFQLAQERQQMSADKISLESLARRVQTEEAKLNARKLKEEGVLETQRQMLQRDEEKLYLEKEMTKQETLQLKAEREALQREKRLAREDRENLEDTKLELKRRSGEVEDMVQRASADKEEGRSALSSARKIEADHHARLNQFTQQMQVLMEKEKQLLQDREKFAEEKVTFEKTKNAILCSNCKLAVGLPMTVLPPSVNQLRPVTPVFTGISNILPQTNADPNLMVWYLTAQKDREYLQEEFQFLQSLKDFGKAPTL